MPAYVDTAHWEWRGKVWCHLLADTLTELHAFAQQLGLRREWFQAESKYPHYDLTIHMRDRAIHLGAVEADNRTICAIADKLRLETHLPQPTQMSLFQ